MISSASYVSQAISAHSHQHQITKVYSNMALHNTEMHCSLNPLYDKNHKATELCSLLV